MKSPELHILERIEALRAELARPVVVALDGGSGSGKSTIAARLAKLTDIALVTLDDFYQTQVPESALLQTWGTAARRHPVGGLGSIGEMLIEHNHGFGQGRGSNSECSFNQAHLPHDTWLQAPCLGLSFA